MLLFIPGFKRSRADSGMTESPSLSSSLSLSFGTPVTLSSSVTQQQQHQQPPAEAAAPTRSDQSLQHQQPGNDKFAPSSSPSESGADSKPAQQQQQPSLAILSPFDEKEEWHKISKIIDSFGTDIGTDVKDSTTPHNCKIPS